MYESKVLIPVRDIEEMTTLSHGTVYKLIGSGQLKTVKVGKRRFITQNQLAEFLKDLETSAIGGPVSSDTNSLLGVI